MISEPAEYTQELSVNDDGGLGRSPQQGPGVNPLVGVLDVMLPSPAES